MDQEQGPVDGVKKAVLDIREDGVTAHHPMIPERENTPPQPFRDKGPDGVPGSPEVSTSLGETVSGNPEGPEEEDRRAEQEKQRYPFLTRAPTNTFRRRFSTKLKDNSQVFTLW
jgi:hypothetical protein